MMIIPDTRRVHLMLYLRVYYMKIKIFYWEKRNVLTKSNITVAVCQSDMLNLKYTILFEDSTRCVSQWR
jgi:hypothetical protein